MASPPLLRTTLLRTTLCLAAATVLTFSTALTMTSAHAASDASGIQRWTTNADFAKGTVQGLKISNNSMTIAKPLGPYNYADPYGSKKNRKFSYGVWTSQWVNTAFNLKTLIPSWNTGSIPNGTIVRVDLRAKTATSAGSWDRVADWAYGTAGTHRNSATAQTDDLTRLNVDTLLANGSSKLRGWQIRIILMRPYGATTTPRLDSVGAIAATFSTRSPAVSRTTMTSNTELAVPRYSQMIHRGQYPGWGGGGASWCSPTSLSMVLRYFKTGPKPADYSWSKYADSWVVHAARYTYDNRYKGAGNWPFNTAYAGRYGLDAFVTRLANLRDAEAFIKKGIPVIASIRYSKGALSGAPVSSSNGHLVVITGVRKDGRVVVNDPAAKSNSTVRRVYNRAQFERAWTGGSGTVSYIVRPSNKPLPPDTVRW